MSAAGSSVISGASRWLAARAAPAASARPTPAATSGRVHGRGFIAISSLSGALRRLAVADDASNQHYGWSAGIGWEDGRCCRSPHVGARGGRGRRATAPRVTAGKGGPGALTRSSRALPSLQAELLRAFHLHHHPVLHHRGHGPVPQPAQCRVDPGQRIPRPLERPGLAALHLTLHLDLLLWARHQIAYSWTNSRTWRGATWTVSPTCSRSSVWRSHGTSTLRTTPNVSE